MQLHLHDGVHEVTSLGVILYLRNNAPYLKDYLIPTLGRLEELYKSVTFTYYIYENDSTDNTVELIRAFAASRRDRCHIYSEILRLNGITKGTSYARIHRMANIRNKLLGRIKEDIDTRHPWCLFIDSDIYFDETNLQAMFTYAPAKNGIAMMTCNTIELFSNTGLSNDVPHDVPFLTENHYYDTFAFVDLDDRMCYPQCVSWNCKRIECKAQDVVRMKPYEVRDVRSAWGGFVVVATSALSHPGVWWKTTGFNNDISLCEHIHFCDAIRTIFQKRIVVLNPVHCYWFPKRDHKLSISLTSIPTRFAGVAPRLAEMLRWRVVSCIYLNISKSYARFPEWDGTIPDVLQTLAKQSNGRLRLNICDDDGPATKYLGAASLANNEWVFVCDDDQHYNLAEINRAFYENIDTSKTSTVWQNGMREEMDLGICGPIAGFKGLFVHSDVLARLKDHPRHDAMYSIDDQWFLVFCTLQNIPICDTGLTRNQIFIGGELPDLHDGLWIQKPRGEVLRSYIRENWSALENAEDQTWKQWNVVKHAMYSEEGTRTVVVLCDGFNEKLFQHVFIKHIVADETYIPMTFEYYFVGFNEPLPDIVHAFAKHRNCKFVENIPQHIGATYTWDVAKAREGRFAMHS
jgi:glycosyltransferase involved in cell wall biosynthesis